MNKHTTKSALNDDDDGFYDEIIKDNSVLGFAVRTQRVNTYKVHINQEIKDASYYSKVFDMMLDATENDTINFFISSGGGDLDGLNVLLEGINLTEAYVRAVIVGSCHSAASLLALSCDDVVVLDSATMLCHGVRTGFGGKLADLDAYTEHSKKVSHKLLKTVYKNFLSDSEISDLISGKELWLTSDEVRTRLTKRNELQDVEQKEIEDQVMKEVSSPQPKKPTKTKQK